MAFEFPSSPMMVYSLLLLVPLLAVVGAYIFLWRNQVGPTLVGSGTPWGGRSEPGGRRDGPAGTRSSAPIAPPARDLVLNSAQATEPASSGAPPPGGGDIEPPDAAPSPTPPATAGAGYVLVWRDEFDGPDINRDNWTFDIGRGENGWGNAELQYYTDRAENARIENEKLVIEARHERYRTHDFTSARLKTHGSHAWAYGRIEASLKVPHGQGIWPAFWSLGVNFETVGWPQCGELDIMEHIGSEPNAVYGTVHGPGYFAGRGVGGKHTLPASTALSDDFHVFAVEWEPAAIRWYIDETLFASVTPDDLPGEWVFDHPFFILLNVAVGGYWPGNPDETTVFPQKMYVDYIRVYQRS